MKSIAMFSFSLMLSSFAFAQKVHVEFDDSIDFKNLRTFTINEGRVRSKHPQLDSSLTGKKIRNAIVSKLAAKGMQETPSGGDVIVAYRLGSQDRRETERYATGWYGRRVRRVTYKVTDATLVIDLLDGKSKDLLWRATCVDTAQDPAKLDDHINKDVDKAFHDFPPKHKK